MDKPKVVTMNPEPDQMTKAVENVRRNLSAKWESRKGGAINTRSDFGAELMEWHALR